MELLVQSEQYDFIGISETWWDNSHDQSTVMVAQEDQAEEKMEDKKKIHLFQGRQGDLEVALLKVSGSR